MIYSIVCQLCYMPFMIYARMLIPMTGSITLYKQTLLENLKWTYWTVLILSFLLDSQKETQGSTE